MAKFQPDIVKASGEKVEFSRNKLKNSLKKSGASLHTINSILKVIEKEIYPDITTEAIYNRAYSLLREFETPCASRYKLKRAIYDLGPTGFPFEHFISALLKHSGYDTYVSKTLQGKCVKHEVDVVATSNKHTTLVECKFHSDRGQTCNIKVPLYILSRYNDIKANWSSRTNNALNPPWVVTNTRFTEDALNFGKCSGMFLLSWDYPKDHALKDRIDDLKLYPITVSSLLSSKEKSFLLNRGIVLCRQLVKEPFYLDHMGLSDIRKEKVLNEVEFLCND
ncbi:restriction endonuclease [Mangrovimonas aestuarii]|uniref:restriction endonuclease n=1 Tax=Mangrovimonas aestuarii TaxID=3018443 RepID=UPI0023799E8B|nr:ATP cone domain-containing protein [Mangrovimonas aestuarii]